MTQPKNRENEYAVWKFKTSTDSLFARYRTQYVERKFDLQIEGVQTIVIANIDILLLAPTNMDPIISIPVNVWCVMIPFIIPLTIVWLPLMICGAIEIRSN